MKFINSDFFKKIEEIGVFFKKIGIFREKNETKSKINARICERSVDETKNIC